MDGIRDLYQDTGFSRAAATSSQIIRRIGAETQ